MVCPARVGRSAGDQNRIPEIIDRVEKEREPEGSKEVWPESL